MERQWQHNFLLKVAKIDENLAVYFTDYSPDSLNDTREFEYRNKSSWLTAGTSFYDRRGELIASTNFEKSLWPNPSTLHPPYRKD